MSVQTLRKSYGITDESAGSLDKLIECPGARDLHRRNATGLLVRLELYVSEENWRTASLHLKQMLTLLIQSIENKMPKVLKAWNRVRYNQQTPILS